jgi:hypothetical protein
LRKRYRLWSAPSTHTKKNLEERSGFALRKSALTHNLLTIDTRLHVGASQKTIILLEQKAFKLKPKNTRNARRFNWPSALFV